MNAAFLVLLPRIERHARSRYRHLRCPHQLADAVAETVGLTWSAFHNHAARGKDATTFVIRLADFMARHIGNDCRFCR